MKNIGRLSDIYVFQYGKGNENPDNGGIYPVYGSNGIIGGYDKFNSDDAPVIGHIGANAGSVVFAKGKHFVTYNGVICEIKDCADKMYGYYALLSSNLKKVAFGSAQPFVSYNSLNRIVIYLPSIEKQKKIANILSTYDELIENNNKRIKLLEQMAENLYREWFVRFRFPGYENTKFENGLPEGWKRNKISTYYDTCSGGTPSRTHEEYFEAGIYPWVKTGEIKDCIIIDTEEYITQQAVKKSSAKLLPAKSVAMAMYGVNIGQLGYFDKQMTCNQACCVFSDKRSFSSKHYLFQYLKSIREYLLLISFGAAQQNLSQELIKKIKIVMPSDDVVRAFEEKMDVIYDSIKTLMYKNQNLAKQRELLLPRLMSGKLEV